MEMDKDTIFLFRFGPKQTELDLFGFCFGLFAKQKLFRVCFRVLEQFETKNGVSKQTETEADTLLCNGHRRGHGHGHGHGHFSFVSVCFEWSWVFRLNRNTEIRCLDIKVKQPKQTSCFE
jgi:hypothetical protein